MIAEILCFTDPFCSWCWATEPMLFRIQETYRGQVRIRYVMGGLVRDMADFYDTLNDIGTFAQVTPHWRMVSERSGQPIDEHLWEDIQDPHFSTWPANVAVKAAELQGANVGERYLRRLRRAALTERAQVQRRDVQLRLAQEVQGLDADRLAEDLKGDAAQQTFTADLALCRRYGVSGFPTMLFQPPAGALLPGGQEGILVGGHRSYDTYEQVLRKVAGNLEPSAPRPVPELLRVYGTLTTRELVEITGEPAGALVAALDQEAAADRLQQINVRGGTFWALPGAG